MIFVEEITEYRPDVAEQLGRLRPFLSEGKPSTPVPAPHLNYIIDSPNYVLLAARHEEIKRIVGSATLSIIRGPLSGTRAHLEDFVADPTVNVRGIGQAMWNAIGAYCFNHELDLEFTSKPTREAAHRFYLKNGAEIRETTVFEKRFIDTDSQDSPAR